jgi:hypothetical protein
MAMSYHVVYETDTVSGPRILEEVAETTEGLFRKMCYLLNRNEDVLGVYITGTSCGDDSRDPRKLRKFIDYLGGLESQVWLGGRHR